MLHVEAKGPEESKWEKRKRSHSFKKHKFKNLKRQLSASLAERQLTVKDRKMSAMLSCDDMNLPETSFSKVIQKVKERSQERGAISRESYYAPVVLCMKTKSSAGNFYESLLKALTEQLRSDSSRYTASLRNVAYSYSEFVSLIISLTHIVNPPPATLYTLEVGNTKLTYVEGPVSQLSYEDDTSVAQLFCVLDSKSVIAVFGALLLDLRVILCAQDVNSCFFLIKGLNQLMFPLKWQYSKGVTLSPVLLYQPYPYFYGILKSLNKEEIANSLRNENYAYLMLDTESLELDIHHERFVPDFPNEDKLSIELDEICAKHNIKRTGKLEPTTQEHVKFSKEMRLYFLNIMATYVDSIAALQKRTKLDDFFLFGNAYAASFKQSHENQEQIKFADELSKSQCFAVAFDEVCVGAQKDYARFEAMRRTKEQRPAEYVEASVNNSERVVVSRVGKLAERAKAEGVKGKWVEEVLKMEKLLDVRRERRFSDAVENKTAALTGIRKKEFANNRREEIKEALSTSEYGEIVKVKKGPLFYGATGMLSFLDELFSLPGRTKNVLSLFNEVKAYLETAREHLANAADAERPFKSVYFAKNSLESSPGSALVSALVDRKAGFSVDVKKVAEPFIKFSEVDCCQFFVFCAHYYSKYECPPLEIAKVNCSLKP